MSLSDSILNSVLKKDEPVEQPQVQQVVENIQENVSKTSELSEGLQSLIEEKKTSEDASIQATEQPNDIVEVEQNKQDVSTGAETLSVSDKSSSYNSSSEKDGIYEV